MTFEFGLVVMEGDGFGDLGVAAVGFDAEQGFAFLFHRAKDFSTIRDFEVRSELGHPIVGEVFSIERITGIPGNRLFGRSGIVFQLANVLDRDGGRGSPGVPLKKEDGELFAPIDEGGGPAPGDETEDLDPEIPLGGGGGDGDFTMIEFISGHGVIACSGVEGSGAFGHFFLFVDLAVFGLPFDELEFADLFFLDEIGDFFDDPGHLAVVAGDGSFDEVVAKLVGHLKEPGFLGGKRRNGCRETEDEFGNGRFHDL